MLAEPSADLAAHTWATLADGTPLVTEATKGAGRIVLFHVTANADWSNLPLSGLFVDMLRRLVALSVGVAAAEGHAMLAPAETLDGFGLLSTPPPSAAGLAADAFNDTAGVAAPSAGAVRAGERPARAEPGRRHAAAAAGAAGRPALASSNWRSTVPEQALGPPLLALAVLLLALDLLIALGLRGLLRLRTAGAAMLLLAALRLRAQAQRSRLETGVHPGAGDAARLHRDRRCPGGRGSRRPGWRGCRTTSTAAPRRRWWNPIRSCRARPT